MDKEIKSLTGIRGVAALWVVSMHYFETLKVDNSLYISKLLANGFVAVDMFFLLSAFVMCLAYSEEYKNKISIQSYKLFIKKRFVRIYPAYIFWLFMFLSFDFVKLNLDYGKILVNLLLIQNLFKDAVVSIVCWSLCAEWILYILFPFLFFILQKVESRLIKIVLILVCLIGIYILPIMTNYYIDFYKIFSKVTPTGNLAVVKGINSIIRCFISYVMGINLFLLIKDYKVINYSLVRNMKYVAVISIFVISYFEKSAEAYVLLVISSVILISTLYLDYKQLASFLASKTLYFLGQTSYSIYLCHQFILIFASILAKKFFPSDYDDRMQILLVLGSLVILIPISYLSYKFIEIKVGLALKSKLFIKQESEKKTGQLAS